jgi:type VI secretion system protein ImpA
MTMPAEFEAYLANAECGEDLEFDPGFIALQSTASGKREQQFGDTIVEAEEPDWRSVEAQALELLDRTRDLRVIGHLAAAKLRTQGLVGYAASVSLIARLLDTHWEAVHPRLDPDDDNDPTFRANAVLATADPGKVLKHLREEPLTRAPRAGRFCWREISLALNLVEAPTDIERPSEATVTAAFAETDPAWMQGIRDAVAGLGQDLKAINTAFEEKAGYGTGPDLTRLEKLVADIHRVLQRFSTVAAEPGADAGSEVTPDAVQGASPAPTAVAAPRGIGFASVLALREVQTRQEALHLLDIVCGYYERCEPSSPLPMLVRRALRLADKNFMDILRELAPDGVHQAQMVVGASD